MIFALVFLTALIVSLSLTPLAIWLAFRIGAVDQPAPRRVHLVPTARFGGLPLFFSFAIALGVSLLFPRDDHTELTKLLGLVIGCALLFLVGAYDDLRELRAIPQFTAQFLAAGITIYSGVLITELPNPFGGAPIQLPLLIAVGFTLFWIVGMVNTINWLDGLDGLASGVTALAGAVLLIHTWRLSQFSLMLPPLALIGAVLGFLVFNRPPAKIFLGGGAYVLGLILAVLSIIGGAKVASALLVLIIPIGDVAWQIVKRIRAGQSPFAADRGHLHHRLLDLGWSPRAVVLLYIALSAFFGALALLLPSGIYKLIALVVISIGSLAILLRLQDPSTK